MIWKLLPDPNLEIQFTMKLKYLLILLIFLSNSVFAQIQDTIIVAHSFSKEKGLQLKWFPASTKLFVAGYENGYNVYRAEAIKISATAEKLSEFVKLNAEPLKIWTPEKLEQAEENDSIYGIAKIFIHNTDMFLQQGGETMKDAIDISERFNMIAFLGNFSAVSSNKVAEAMGMYYADNSCDPLKKYVYKIEINTSGNYYSTILIQPQITVEKEKVVGVTATVAYETVNLSWFDNTAGTFTFYNIYRSKQKDKGYERLNAAPYLGAPQKVRKNKNTISYSDSIREYGAVYYYKVIGINVFEEEGIPSDPIMVKTIYRLRRAPKVINVKEIGNQEIELTWQVPQSELPYMKGYSIFRSSEGNINFSKIHQGYLPVKQMSFVDATDKTSSNYYKVCAYGESGDSICSLLKAFLLVDSIPPTAPEIGAGVCDSSGVVTISWNHPPEPDVMGYRVFRTYNKKREVARITKGHIADTLYVDTVKLKQPHSKIFYKIVAIDAHANPSDFSDFIEVALPDLLPPEQAYFKSCKSTVDGIYLSWQPSASPDVKALYLERKSKLDFEYETILSCTGDSLQISEYVDSATVSNIEYSYRLVVKDESGLFSKPSDPIRIVQLKKDKILSVSNLEAIVSKKNKMIKLVWEYPANAEGFRIYRAEGNGKLKTYTFAEGTKREFYDKRIKPNTHYTYMLIAELKGGFTSGYSKKVKVKY